MQWHPDKWVGMSIYTLIVQSAFEVITNAHERLQNSLDWELLHTYKKIEEDVETIILENESKTEEEVKEAPVFE